MNKACFKALLPIFFICVTSTSYAENQNFDFSRGVEPTFHWGDSLGQHHGLTNKIGSDKDGDLYMTQDKKKVLKFRNNILYSITLVISNDEVPMYTRETEKRLTAQFEPDGYKYWKHGDIEVHLEKMKGTDYYAYNIFNLAVKKKAIGAAGNSSKTAKSTTTANIKPLTPLEQCYRDCLAMYCPFGDFLCEPADKYKYQQCTQQCNFQLKYK